MNKQFVIFMVYIMQGFVNVLYAKNKRRIIMNIWKRTKTKKKYKIILIDNILNISKFIIQSFILGFFILWLLKRIGVTI